MGVSIRPPPISASTMRAMGRSASPGKTASKGDPSKTMSVGKALA